MSVTASLVKELRERTGSGMMECKKALVEVDGDIDAAIELMRKSGLAKADMKSGRIAAEGGVFISISDDQKTGFMLEVNSETDFVAIGDEFITFANTVMQQLVKHKPADIAAVMELPFSDNSDKTIETARQEIVVKIGENILLRRLHVLTSETGVVGWYRHGSRIGVLVDGEGASESLLKDVAMHVAALNPETVTAAGVAQQTIDKEREIILELAKKSGKPDNIVEKIVDGRINKFINEITLYGQPFVKDPDMTVEALMKQEKATIKQFVRCEVGEGIEKKEDNFAEEVMAQIKAG